MRILVCGGRTFDDDQKLSKVLNLYRTDNMVIIQGEAKGADTLAKFWAKRNNVPFESYPADWNKYGKRAGYIRNNQMLNEGKPDLVIAFPGGVGTQMMIHLSKAAGISVVEVDAT